MTSLPSNSVARNRPRLSCSPHAVSYVIRGARFGVSSINATKNHEIEWRMVLK